MKNVPSNSNAFMSYIFLMGSGQRETSKCVKNLQTENSCHLNIAGFVVVVVVLPIKLATC